MIANVSGVNGLKWSGLNSEDTLITKTVDDETCNPLRMWHDIGEPAYPTEAENALIRSAAVPAVRSAVISAENGKLCTDLSIRKDGVMYFELNARTFTPDRGYDYEKAVSFR